MPKVPTVVNSPFPRSVRDAGAAALAWIDDEVMHCRATGKASIVNVA